MNTALWIIQGLLAAMFAVAGLTKLTQPKEKLENQMPWTKDFSMNTIKFIGLSELLGAIGIIIPWLTGIAPILTPVAALGICLIMVLATITVHLRSKEYKQAGMNTILFFLAAFVAYGRF
jgi:uncharacterized membrane protein YphA (DoxX/SURF4 family)